MPANRGEAAARSDASNDARPIASSLIALTMSSSSYPPPPVAPGTDATATDADTAQQGTDSHHNQHHNHNHNVAHSYQTTHAGPAHAHTQYIADAAAAAAAAAAHHGLQALQAAVAGPNPAATSPMTSQHAGSISDPSLNGNASVPGAAMASQPQKPKLTRLRRACDMCSQRKVKVSMSRPPEIFATLQSL